MKVYAVVKKINTGKALYLVEFNSKKEAAKRFDSIGARRTDNGNYIFDYRNEFGTIIPVMAVIYQKSIWEGHENILLG